MAASSSTSHVVGTALWLRSWKVNGTSRQPAMRPTRPRCTSGVSSSTRETHSEPVMLIACLGLA